MWTSYSLSFAIGDAPVIARADEAIDRLGVERAVGVQQQFPPVARQRVAPEWRQRGARPRRDMPYGVVRVLLHQCEVWCHPAGSRRLLRRRPAQALRHDGALARVAFEELPRRRRHRLIVGLQSLIAVSMHMP